MRWLGIDGGGTKTAFTLFDDDLEALERFVLPTCHYAQVGFDGMERVLAEGARRAEVSGLLGDSFGIGMGICGFGEGAEPTRRIREAARRVAAGRPLEIVNDVEAAWAAGLGLRDGIVIIAGTGSIAYGTCEGRSMRCGGWDFELGDEGSAGWLGKELLYAFTRQCDGREPAGAIRDTVRTELHLEDDFDLIGFARQHMADRGSIAALAPLVTQAARAGDPGARDILARAAREEASMVLAIVRSIFPQDNAPIPVTYIGGTFNAGDLILRPLAQALPERCRLVAPERNPDAGACLLLRRRLREGNAAR